MLTLEYNLHLKELVCHGAKPVTKIKISLWKPQGGRTPVGILKHLGETLGVLIYFTVGTILCIVKI